MNPTVRKALGVLAGLGVAIGIIFGVEGLNGVFFPLPPGTDISNPEAMKAVLAGLPTMALVVVLIGWALGSVLGGWVATAVGGRTRGPATVLGAILFLGALYNLYTIPHPAWFWVPGLLVWLPGVKLGEKLGTRG